MARKFLYIIAGLIVLVLIAAFAWALFNKQILKAALVPTAQFSVQPAQPTGVYASPDMWFSRPGKTDDPARWTPPGYAPGTHPQAAVFFIHPTSYLSRTAWNAPLDDADANQRARLFLRGQASAFNEIGEVWAPRYRQATFGAFLTSKAEADQALDLAYKDILAAFDAFVRAVPQDRPIILAGHSQGALHLTRLLRERIAGTPLARRIVAAYVVGWPISLDTDLKALGLPACKNAGEARCILSWQSFAEPAEPALILDTYDATTGFDGRPRRDTAFLCTNPLTGTQEGAAPASANLGTLFPRKDLSTATIEPGRVPARCEGRGFLMIGDPVDVGPYVLPGNNYHVFDYSLFWANVRADAKARLATYLRP